MIRVCHVQLWPMLSGVQRVMLSLLERIDRTRYKPQVICRQPGPLTRELDHLGIRCHFVPQLVRPIRPHLDWWAYRSLRKLFRELRPDIVHTHSSKPGFLGRLAARAADVPHVIHHVHGFSFHEYSSRIVQFVFPRLERLAGRSCDRVVFVNEEERAWAVGNGVLPAEKSRTIYNGVDLNVFAPPSPERRAELRRRLDVPDDCTVVPFLGRLVRQKQPLILADIAARLNGELAGDRAWQIWVCGDGPLRDGLLHRCRQQGTAERVRAFRWHERPQDVLGAADLALLPSLWDGMPLSLLEAAGTGLPVVCSAIRGNREVVTAETGFLCSPRDAGQYATRIARLIADDELRASMGRAARQRAEAMFDADLMAARIGELYGGLAGSAAEPLPAFRRAA
ncbi:MAG TPA: glycosyltransferase family 4 protein [Planctomycetaceae bacterium]|nr:glycosyltransferase family 4 protein [Planctomycetaceae bacterium]